VLGHLTEAQRRAYRIADNKLTELGGWDEALLLQELQALLAEDFDLGLIGIPEDELDALLPTLTDMGASFAIATGGVLTLFIAAPPNGSSVWVRVVDEVSGAIFEQEITADLPAATQFLSPRLFMNTGATAAAVAYDCAGVYLETDF
jgi:hypothetical protein